MRSEEQLSIAKGSKSFYLASIFFPQEIREASWQLYRWCRYCDDQIDTASSREEAVLRLKELQQKTSLALRKTIEQENLEPEFQALHHLCQKYRIPSRYPLDLIAGFEMDVQARSFRDLQDLEVYGYHVAGVVGLMMTHIFGVSSPEAMVHAVDLGVAMQLTNIARDLQEDYQLQRIYLPRTWLTEAGVPAAEFFNDEHHEKVKMLARRLLVRADELYKSGYAGLHYLPWRAALAVSIAGSIYSFIGWKVRRQRSLRHRVYVNLPQKVCLAIAGGIRVVPLLFSKRRPYEIGYRN